MQAYERFQEKLPFPEFKEGTEVNVVGTILTGTVVGCNPQNDTVMVNIRGTVQSVKHHDLIVITTGETMKRYTRSFIGLMEQNNEGEWISYADVAKLESDKQATLSALGTLGEEVTRLKAEINTLTSSRRLAQNDYSRTLSLLNKTKKALGLYRITVVLVIVILGVGLVGRFL